MTTTELIEEAISLPIEERAFVIDSLLKSLNPPKSDIDLKWGQVALRRREELRSGRVKGIPGDEIFERIWKTFSE